MSRRLRCAIAGCGMVADEYASTLRPSTLVELVACTDIDLDRARAFADRHGISYVAPFQQLDADVILVLTPPEHHAHVASSAISAGMSVYVEKPLAGSVAEAESLLAMAERSGVLVGAAPDTFLAPPTHTAAVALTSGLIGEPIAGTGALLSPGPERWHPNPQPIYDLGPLLDMGPYYLSVLTALLGPIGKVRGATCRSRSCRTRPSGEVFTTASPTHVEALLETTTGVSITLTTSFDVQATTRPHLEIYGTEGTLVLLDPNFHEGVVRVRRRDETNWRVLPQEAAEFEVIGRGMGVLDLADAMLSRRPSKASGESALHVLRVTEAIRQAAESNAALTVPRSHK
ncbi:Gfo/Idh/MocA family protein [Spongiactinospora sp. 9N601]|uniref:Gfo/Idh/MocA family protein n=1 Tax=Spongiactinospora sp. 9N601 TaxID=3375149 RepID=UPI0037934C98